jgi:cytochrome c-type biogenesis protein CcmH
MTGFLIGAVVALLATLLLLLRPFLWQRARATASHRQLNAAIYRDQLAEIERDRAAGTLAEEDYATAREELQRRVLEDGQAEDTAATLKAPKKTLVALALLLPIASIGLYLVIGHPEGANPAAQHRVSAQDIERMVATLADKMEKEPGNVEGWGMLARSYKAMGRVEEATKAFEHVMSLHPTDAQVYADYADVLAMKAGGNFAGKPQQLIDQALKLDPDNLEALWLSGTAAYEAGRYAQAATTWSRLQKRLPPESDDAKQIAAGIADARAKAGMPAAPAAADPAKAVRGRVELAPSMKGQVSADDTVMIVAREAGGPRMPVAVLKLRAGDLPRDFALDDSLAMTPDRNISSIKNLEIEARVSKSGQAMPQRGDLFSAAQKAKAGASGLKLTIDQVRQ